MPDTTLSPTPDYGVSSRAQVDAEWRDLEPALKRVIAARTAFLNAVNAMPRPMWTHEVRAQRVATEALAERLADDLKDWMGDVMGPFLSRADEAGDLAKYEAEIKGMGI